ncbi:hypothetical protein RSOLAG22IIIB_10084 [Rhizoctonia solani]|uniref:Uncharacterized protein n=1 Tax=Rhizoctonia solani TaxID=456999 RepID=A0A0K6G167_9AGAM|nr:hypothetical protein RSOLAG22IIIB_10084 [Rhizoctonia solani]
MPFRWPDPIQYIYQGFEIQKEDFALDTEDPIPAKKGQVKVRALDGFLFIRKGKFFYPTQGLPDEWWKEVTVFGYISALTGNFKYYIWAGQWDEDYDDKHHEVVVLGNLSGISWSADQHWRNGSEPTLWLDTKLGFSYALLEPAEEYDRGSWAPTALSWINASDTAQPTDGLFHRVERHDPRPTWWDSTGDDAWERFQRQVQTKPIAEDVGKARSVTNTHLANGSCATEPIDVDLFDEVHPTPCMVAPKVPFGQPSKQPVLKTVSKPKKQTQARGRPVRKPKVLMGPSKPRQRRKQEIKEEIYITSD